MKEALKEGHVHLEPPVARRRKKATVSILLMEWMLFGAVPLCSILL